MPEYRHRASLDHPPEEVFAWQTRPGALARLSPPWWRVQVLPDTRELEAGSRIRLKARLGPVPVSGELEITERRAGESYVAEQVSGPFASWRHECRFQADERGGTRVLDHVVWDPPGGALGKGLSEPTVGRALRRLFGFRTRRMEGDLARIRRYGAGGGRWVAITGSTGLVGAALASQLEAAGYQVRGISRSGGGRPGTGVENVRWDPATDTLSPERLEGLYAVVHLAGESIAGVRWTRAKKAAILSSRVDGTALLSRTLAQLSQPPEVLVSASAVGYYGHRGAERVTEDTDSGQGFLADVCRKWEASTHLARAMGIRTVLLRGGLVLSPEGGPLETLLIPFGLGLGGRIGSGRQYLSWIDLDDHTGMILHAMGEERVRGALNSTSPNPLTNAAFTDVLGRVLRRPTLLPVPAFALSALLGEMGVELLLSGQRVLPQKAIDTGFAFDFPDLEESLRHQLGREEKDE